MRYPETGRGDAVDVLHGTAVADPYRWLEDPDAPAVRQWVAAQAGCARAWLDGVPALPALREVLAARWSIPRRGVPWRRGARWFQLRNSGLQEQDVLWVADAPEGDGRVLVDPNTWSVDGTVALADVAVSHDGALLAYARSEAGSDWLTWQVLDIADRTVLPGEGRWGKFTGAAWTHDRAGFFYGGYDPPPAGAEHTAPTRHHKLRYHRLDGVDAVVCERPDQPEWGFAPVVTDDGRWLVVTVWQGTDPRTRVHLADLQGTTGEAAVVRPWLDGFDAAYTVVGQAGDDLLVLTDLDAPRRRILAVDPADPTRRREVIAETQAVLSDARVVGSRLLVVRMVDAAHRLALHDLDGRPAGEVALPDLGSITGLSGGPEDDAAHLAFTTFTAAPSLHRVDVATGARTEIRPSGQRVERAVTDHVLVASTDGAQVPLFCVHRADVTPDGNVPTLLYGYGGFDIAITPQHRVWWGLWVECGGLLAVGCYRGGGEYGRTWHDAGRLGAKQHTIDDALACADWLVASGWTRPGRLAITGASNGGLTAAAAMLQRPDAFGACVAEVGVHDLLRYHRFTIGWAWASDFGTADDPEEFAVLHALSPYHNVRPGVAYPATLLTTADHDDRVVPAHSYKLAAALQHAQAGEAPVLLRVEQRAGHGATTPTSKQIDGRADVLAFLQRALGMA